MYNKMLCRHHIKMYDDKKRISSSGQSHYFLLQKNFLRICVKPSVQVIRVDYICQNQGDKCHFST